jgi:AmmeMemoRadiSam system protein A
MRGALPIKSEVGRGLLEYADAILESAVKGYPPTETVAFDPALHEILQREYGAFSTLKKRTELRGCIGNFAGSGRLGTVLPRVVTESALRDYRFPPVTLEELPEIDLSLSILYPAYRIDRASEIELGRDGTILSVGRHRGVFLPEVAIDQGWDVETMLSALSRKAGLPLEGWRSPDATLEVFQTTHISWVRTAAARSKEVRIEGGPY